MINQILSLKKFQEWGQGNTVFKVFDSFFFIIFYVPALVKIFYFGTDAVFLFHFADFSTIFISSDVRL